VRTYSTTVAHYSASGVLNEPWREIKQSKKDELLKVMEMIWITLSHSQKEALIAEATRASSLNSTIAAFQEIQMEALKVKPVKEKEVNK
jgi:hypothetical protein